MPYIIEIQYNNLSIITDQTNLLKLKKFLYTNTQKRWLYPIIHGIYMLPLYGGINTEISQALFMAT